MTSAPSPSAARAATIAQEWGLRHLGGRPALGPYLVALWQRRHFILELARSKFRAENEADRLGAAWIILRPLINAAVYGTVFGVILLNDKRPDDYVPFLVSGVFLFQYWAGCFADGSRAIVNNMGLVTTLHFPRAALPIAVVLQQLMGMLWMILTLGVITLAFGDPIRVSWLLVVPALALMTLFNLGVAFFAARMTIHLRDIAQLIPFISRMFFYLSGIFVPMASVVHNNKSLLAITEANPLYVYISLIRAALIGPRSGEHFDAVRTWEYGVLWGVGLMVAGLIFFWRAEAEYGRE